MKERSSLVSVVIPSYNQKEYLEEAIESVLSQDYSNIELVIADDFSTDGTDIMMKKYILNTNIKYFRNKVNLGANRNVCQSFYSYVRGEFVLYLNHDDYFIDPHYISRAVKFLVENPKVSVVFANYRRLIQETGEVKDIIEPTKNIITPGKDYFYNYQLSHNGYPGILSLTALFRRDCAIKTKCFQEKTAINDFIVFMKLMLAGDVGHFDSIVSVYRVHKKSITFNSTLDDDMDTIKEIEELYKLALDYGFTRVQLDKWLEARIIIHFVYWRFPALLKGNDTETIKRILLFLKNEYPSICVMMFKILDEQGILKKIL
ncbi:hypothetical protein BAMA_14700 [Bacillus manliponensis]|uniref:Glycosyltransferase 2-like domain-containing protein n=1 Tax=Bacillus manliponensis TaxID=574376 RepID=A0A073K269_9BACI|nr:glycosyltransferase family 2 protein [Bacillus manliponensis]KEK20656.1 hypothetical protein BAMA_14700 [Bacillus manliponensis]